MRIYKTIKTAIFVIIIIVVIIIIARALKLKSDFGNIVGDELNRIGKYLEAKGQDVIPVVTEESPETPKIKRGGVKKSKAWKMEEICRTILEEYFDDYFPSCRPKFLKNPKTGRPLELDGYNARLNLAFEYNGRQHSEYPNNFHKTREEFDNQVERDLYKYSRCKELGIDLILIPYTVKEDDLKSYILSKIKSVGK